MVANNFKDIFKKIDKSINTSKNQALNRAATSTRAKYAKDVSADLGVPSAKVKARAKIYKPTESRPQMALSIGVKVKFAAQDFKTGKQVVKTRLGKRWAATYTVKSMGKIVLPGTFQAVKNGLNSSKKLVLQRQGGPKYPTKTVEVDVFAPTVEKHVPQLQDHMKQSFETNLNAQLKYNLSK